MTFMPLYTFTCLDPECGHKADQLRKVDDRDAPITCGECGGNMIRVTALPSDAVFKGSGWTPKHY
jgi:putative FmdB family regulatory protein